MFIYKAIFMIPYIQGFHLAGLFLMLGIGGDDLFVFWDAWLQARDEITYEIGGDNYRFYRLMTAYDRTYQ